MSGRLRILDRSGAVFVALAFLTIMLSGCAAPIVAGITLSDMSLVAGAVSTATTGKGLTDHALSFATGKNCDLMEGILRKSRKICEDQDSPETKKDFKGFFTNKDAQPAAQPAATAPEAPSQVASSTPPANSGSPQMAQSAAESAPQLESDKAPAAPEPTPAVSFAGIIAVPTALPRPKPFDTLAPVRQAAIYPPQ